MGEITVIISLPEWEKVLGYECNFVNVAWDWDSYTVGLKACEDWDALPVEYKNSDDEYYGKMTKGKRPQIPAWGWCGLEELELIENNTNISK